VTSTPASWGGPASRSSSRNVEPPQAISKRTKTRRPRSSSFNKRPHKSRRNVLPVPVSPGATGFAGDAAGGADAVVAAVGLLGTVVLVAFPVEVGRIGAVPAAIGPTFGFAVAVAVAGSTGVGTVVAAVTTGVATVSVGAGCVTAGGVGVA